VSNRCVDAQRFAEHVELARLEDARGNASLAIHHYAIAESLYQGPLLSTEPAEPCFAAPIALVETQYATLLRRLVELHTAENEHEAAHKYYLRLAKRHGERGDGPRTARTRKTDLPVVS
jgi:hypothetical protein